ncbi:MAG: cytochrome c [Synechococcus sp. SB0668_bin_15]|nr:cytochrome c [Synechococcus sp. SB0668_bin_15]MXZ83249.1 cytochrome c [Synechococcus sp. SB0666_bin_14]MYC50671.1 cytochrome c [Synechococcus sp. SB0662_bin_14]MYG46260.1 cytochrome c [Synechococcus sp. SB0675_bin_6]MYJ59655.1 cytochrome c [Synechococcus sp. SB0672_bin_6]MYK91795.1 cytochrome c [Synechococcus sp. SB0669_bin_8]
MTNSAEPGGRPRTFIAALATLAATACAVLAFALYQAAVVDPYTQAVLALDGHPGQGGRLFRINCAGCHGLAAQGLVGPDLHGVTDRKNDVQLVRQVVSGQTPPMPKFELEPQAMADLISHLHHLETQPAPAVS